MTAEPGDGATILSREMAATFAAYDGAVRAELLTLRQLILDTAEETAGVGTIEETLKWGQPSYLTTETRSGSTVRIAPTSPGSDHDYALFFICNTDLIERFRDLFGEALTYDGKRALLFSVGAELPEEVVRECVAMALTYHRDQAVVRD